MNFRRSIALVLMSVLFVGCNDSDSKPDWLASMGDDSTQVSDGSDKAVGTRSDNSNQKLPPRYDANNLPPGARKNSESTHIPLEGPNSIELVPSGEVATGDASTTVHIDNTSPSEPSSIRQPRQTQPPTSRSNTTAGAEVIQLSTGVALAQSLPSGTAMLFSVMYRLKQSLPGRSARYFWVIVSRDGDQVAFQQTLQKSSDTLSAVVPKWRPDREPFRCHIEEVLSNGSRKRISNSIALIRTK